MDWFRGVMRIVPGAQVRPSVGLTWDPTYFHHPRFTALDKILESLPTVRFRDIVCWILSSHGRLTSERLYQRRPRAALRPPLAVA
jgi:hypothetical protein